MRVLTTILMTTLLGGSINAQEIPLFAQKLTSSFLYNPALAGLHPATVTYSYRRNYLMVDGAPESHFFSGQSPLGGNRFGVGLNLYQENINFMRNTLLSGAFAWHLQLDNDNTLSFGTSGEITNYSIAYASNTSGNTVDPVLVQYGNNQLKFDAGAGVHFQSRYFSAGFALNRLASSWISTEAGAITNSFSAYGQGTFPLRGKRDSIEPYVSLRRLSSDIAIWDVGLFYMLGDRLIAGAGIRKGDVIHMTLGVRLPGRLMVGYSRESISNTHGPGVGSTNEVVLRYDFPPPASWGNSVLDCKAGNPYGVSINTRYRRMMQKAFPGTRLKPRKSPAR